MSGDFLNGATQRPSNFGPTRTMNLHYQIRQYIHLKFLKLLYVHLNKKLTNFVRREVGEEINLSVVQKVTLLPQRHHRLQLMLICQCQNFSVYRILKISQYQLAGIFKSLHQHKLLSNVMLVTETVFKAISRLSTDVGVGSC